MSGIVIDVDTNSTKAQQDLKSLNRSLAQMILTGSKANNIGNVDTKPFKDLNRTVNESSSVFRNFRSSGSSSLRAVASDSTDLRANLSLLKALSLQLLQHLLLQRVHSYLHKQVTILTLFVIVLNLLQKIRMS